MFFIFNKDESVYSFIMQHVFKKNYNPFLFAFAFSLTL